MNKTNNLITKIVGVLAAIINLFFFYFLFKYKILPGKYRLTLAILMGALICIFLYMGFLRKKSSKTSKLIAVVLLLCISLGELTFLSYANKSIRTVAEINNKPNEDTSEMSFVVLKDSPIKSLVDLDDKEIATADGIDKENTDKALAKYKEENEKALRVKDFDNYQKSATALLDGSCEVMLLNESFRPILDETIDGFSEKTRVLKSVLVTSDKKKDDAKAQVKENQSFNVFLSGIDTSGSLSNVSRSDVNMILSVNPIKKKILITTIPRDTYLSIGGGGDKYDKLTHAGLFGVDTSIKSVEKLLDVKIDYYGKVNFTTLIQLINVLGGITVDNPVAFESTSGIYYFPKGKIDMDGDMALSFSRERYHLQEGDFDRGKNHTRVLTGIIKKMLSPEMLLNFNKISDIALESINTDVPYEKMIELVNKQLADGANWQIESQALKGKGSMDLKSYLMPGADLYMMVPSKNSIEDLHTKILENNK